MNILIMILAILPGLLICYGIYRYDKYNKEPAWHLAGCFIAGMLITYPAIQIEWFAEQQGWEHTSFWGLLLVAFVFVALNEELLKYLVVLIYPFPRKFFDEPLDGIVYAIMTSMGFATLENVIYAYRFGFETTLIRSFTAVPAHAAFAVLAGYFIGRARFEKAKRIPLLGLGLLAAVIPHGLYDFFILQDVAEWMIGLVLPLLGICIFFAIRLVKSARRASQFLKVETVVVTADVPIDNNISMEAGEQVNFKTNAYDQMFDNEEEE